ncbi:MAG: class I SAM-dependent methyltransferase, partial [Victivallales bacterium]|nr:class I SAM-dependent methyltransferase [Victivallales bacterium]
MTHTGKVDLAFVRSSYAHGDTVAAYAGKASRGHQRDACLPGFLRGLLETYLPKGERILDAGCAAGEVAHAMVRLGYREVIGVDLSPEMLAAARDVSPRREPSPSFHVDDLTHLAFPDLHFGGAVALHAVTPIPT